MLCLCPLPARHGSPRLLCLPDRLVHDQLARCLGPVLVIQAAHNLLLGRPELLFRVLDLYLLGAEGSPAPANFLALQLHQ